jgi:hypothetical protein
MESSRDAGDEGAAGRDSRCSVGEGGAAERVVGADIGPAFGGSDLGATGAGATGATDGLAATGDPAVGGAGCGLGVGAIADVDCDLAAIAARKR